jgi:CelD/BcsL family acetyltransferase involved in cellulose biosynthesis
MMSVREIGAQELTGLREEWNGLLARSRADGPMLTWEWVFSWWEAYRDYGVHRELYVLEARQSDRLVGIAPFVRRPARQFGLPLTRIEFVGTGEDEADETCSEYLDAIVDRDHQTEAAQSFAEYLLEDRRWDEIVCRDVRQDCQSVAQLMREALQTAETELHIEEFGGARCPVAILPKSWDEYLSGLSSNSRRLLRHKRREALAEAKVEFATASTAEDLTPAFGEFVRLHQQRWRVERKRGCFDSPAFSRFMELLCPRLAASGGVEISSLTMHGDVAVVYFLLKHENRLYYYNSGMDMERWAQFSPGSVCLGYIIEDAIRRGIAEFHFLKGGGGSYKYHWTHDAVPVSSLLVRRRNWKHGAWQLAERARARRRAKPEAHAD